jgi:phosphatidylinositol alpha-1,6-mannosyltransferase
MVLHALPQVLESHPDVHYVMAGGSDINLQRRLEMLVADLDLKEHATLLVDPPNESVAYLYAECDVFIMANRTMPNGDTEGYGIVFLEAGSWGKPVIGGRAGGAVEAVDDGVTGILVDGADPGDIARAVIRLLSDHELARRMGEAGQQKVQRESWNMKSQQYLGLLRRLSGDGGHRSRGARRGIGD